MICFLFTSFLHSQLQAKETLRVGLEIAAPLIQKDGKGILNRLLRELEQKSGYEFSIEYMTYGRALVELQKGRLDLIGITPTGNETKGFYEYAVDLDWSFVTHNIIFYKEKNQHKTSLNDFALFGTLPGNEAFMAEMLGLDISRFHGGPLKSLFKMLEKGRLDAVIFESISSITTLKEMNLKGLLYKKVNQLNGGFSLSKSKPMVLKKLNSTLNAIDTQKYFKPIKVVQKLEGVETLGGLQGDPKE